MATILVADDRAENRELIVTLLSYQGHQVLEASNGQEALLLTRSANPDLVITDVLMPIMDGYEYVRQLRSDAKIAQTVVVFYTSTYHEPEARKLAKSLGVTHFLLKPVEPEIVYSTVSSALGLSANYEPSPQMEEFNREHLLLMTNKLVEKVEELEKEIAERKHAEEELKQAKDYAENIIQTANVIFLQLDSAGNVQRINTAAEEICGYSRAEVEGHSWFELVVPKDRYPFVWEEFLRLSQPGNMPVVFENPILTKLGEERQILWKNTVLYDGENAIGTISFGIDITERKQAEAAIELHAIKLEQRVAERTADLNRLNTELERANHAKDEFLATMSHELRSPLTGILGLTESLLLQNRGPLNETQIKWLEAIGSSGKHLLELINDILDISKIEAGKLEIHPEIILVNDACNASLLFVKESAFKKQIKLDFNHEFADLKIFADPRRLKQILINLLTNAVKFTPEKGHVALEVQTDPDKRQLHFIVTDTGIGITAENLRRLFKPFVQVDSSLSRQFEGTGLGLALVLKLVEMHGGGVSVESEIDKGSRFMVSLPWQPSSTEGQQTVHPHSEPTSEPITSTQEYGPVSRPVGIILLAEDNEINIMTTANYLENEGYRIVNAQNGIEVITKTEEFNPDLILMDIQMPVMDELETTRRLRADPRFESTPIIALTALAMPGDRERCMNAGVNDYMSKPFSLRELVGKISRLLNKDS